MKTLNLLRRAALPAILALAVGLAGCGGGGGNPADPVVTPGPLINPNPPNPGPGAAPTIAFASPVADLYFTGPMEFAFTVTGSPDKVELYKNGALEATLKSPYAYRWENPSEPEGSYTFTAKAIKSGTADVTSAPRTITIDRTFPELVSRTPANGARNVLSGEEISLTFSEPMLASSIDANSVRLYIGTTELASTTSLDSTGKKIRVAFVRTPILPATVTLVVNGVKDLSGKAATVPDISFGMVSVIFTGGTPTVALSFSTNTGTSTNTITKLSRGKTLGTHLAVAQIAWASLPANVKNSELFVGEKLFAVGDQINSNQDPENCTLGGYCTQFRVYFTPFSNGTLPMKARLTLVNGTVIESEVKPLVVNIPNGITESFPLGWTKLPENANTDVGSVGVLLGIPSVYATFAANPRSYAPNYSFFFSHIGARLTGGTIEYSRSFPVLSYGSDDEFLPSFSALYFNPSGQDIVRARSRSCRANGECSVWNSSIGSVSFSDGTGGLGTGAPIIPGVTYIQVVISFETNFKANSDAAIGNLFWSY